MALGTCSRSFSANPAVHSGTHIIGTTCIDVIGVESVDVDSEDSR